MAMEHTVKSFSEELSDLKTLIRDMGALAREQVAAAVKALVDRDAVRAQAIVEKDRVIDDLHMHVRSTVRNILARRQPVAKDLRQIVACERMATDIERIGDHAKNIAKRSMLLTDRLPPAALAGIIQLSGNVQPALETVLAAFEHADPEAALRAWQRDQSLDHIFNTLFGEIIALMREDPSQVASGTHLLFMAKGLERIGDHATNMAEEIVYWATGQVVTAERPKADLNQP